RRRRGSQRRGGAEGRAASAAQRERAAADGAGDFKKSGGILRQGAAVKFRFVKDHRRRWPVQVMCRVLRVTRGGFYAWLKRKPAKRQVRQDELLAKIRVAHAQNRELYGSPRVHRALLIDGEMVSR